MTFTILNSNELGITSEWEVNIIAACAARLASMIAEPCVGFTVHYEVPHSNVLNKAVCYIDNRLESVTIVLVKD